MKCDELKQVENPIEWGLYYDKAEVDEAIAELKARIQLDDDEMAGFLDLEEECGGGDLRNYIAELKAKLEEKDKEIAELKQKLEDAQAKVYADSIDAWKRERRLRRALWLTRAERASDKARIFYFAETCGVKLNINGYSTKEKGCTRMCTARWWMITWLKVERKCRAKAEEYK